MTVQQVNQGAADRAMSRYQKLRRLLLALLIAAVAFVLAFGASAHDNVDSTRIAALGLVLIAFGIGGRMWCTLYIGGRKSSEIVQTGPYSVMRNPLYFFSAVAAAGAGAQAGSAILALAFGLVCTVAFLIVIHREEAYLEQKFGGTFRAYVARVPRFFPDPRLFRDEEQVWFRPALLRTTFGDGLVFFLPAILFAALRAAQDDGLIPVLYRLW